MFVVENQGVNTFLSYLIKSDDVIDDLSLGMLTNNKIKGVAPILYTQLNEDKFLKFNISSKVPASKLFGGLIKKNILLSVVSDILNAIMSAEEYMVDSSLLMLDLEHIYIDISSYEVLVICLPIVNLSQNIDLCQFFKNIIFGVRYDQTENCDYVPVIINYLNSTSVFSPFDFKRLIDNLRVKEEPKVVKPVSNIKYEKVTDVAKPISSNTPISKPTVIENQPSQIKPNTQFSVPDAIPSKRQINEPLVENKPVSEPKSEKMSFFYLICHYNKENAEIYKSQKGSSLSKQVSSNNKNAVLSPAKDSKNDKKKNNKKGSKPSDSNSNVEIRFVVPGRQPELVSKDTSAKKVETPNAKTIEDNDKLKSASPGIGIIEKREPKTVSADFGDTTVLRVSTASGETSLLSANVSTVVKARPYLIRIKNGEKVIIDKPRFRIGKENSYVDYFIGDNTAISRSHADIIVKGNSYYLVDLNSTNHTFVNGVMLQNGEEKQIMSGNRIRIANEEFDFVEEI